MREKEDALITFFYRDAVDGCIHKAAGSCLYDECHSLNGCETGKAKITCGYDLPARWLQQGMPEPQNDCDASGGGLWVADKLPSVYE
ncbi:hypothetical protein PAMP_001855 [Pampus punctatissimus]